MKHLLILLISILLLSSIVIGQSSKYESVNQCVLQTMEVRKLTGNKMFEMVKEECERSLGNSENKEKEKKGVLYSGFRNGKGGWYKEKWEGGVSEDNFDIGIYEGEIKNGFRNGKGTYTSVGGRKHEGEWKDDRLWNGTLYKNGTIFGKFVNGKYTKQ